MNARLSLLSIILAQFASVAVAGDWTRFRGPNGSGLAPDDKALPTEWSDEKNLQWKAPLPGAGVSSPIVCDDRVFVTCWSGSASGREGGSGGSTLKRHLVCVDRATGKVLWDQAITAKL